MTSDGEDDWRPSFNTDLPSRWSKTTIKSAGQEPGSKGCTFNAFMSCTPERFDGECDPLKAISWIREMEEVFHSSQCAEDDKLVYAHTLLKSEAFSWWNSLTTVRGANGVIDMSWEEFKLIFMAKFCPKFAIHQLEDEFMRLEQRGMTVREYTTKFYEKAKFAKFYVSTEEQKVRRYIWGLNSFVREFVMGFRPTTFQAAVNSAERGEKYVAKKEDWRQSQKRKEAMENLLGVKFPSSKKLRQAKLSGSKKLTPGKGLGSGSASVSASGCKLRQAKLSGSKKLTPGKGLGSGSASASGCIPNSMPRLCYHCGKDGHKAADCKGERVTLCFKCMSPNHIQSSCPLLAVQGGKTNDQKKVTKQNVKTGKRKRDGSTGKSKTGSEKKSCQGPGGTPAKRVQGGEGKEEGGGSSSRRTRTCFTCLDIAANCPKGSTSGTVQGGGRSGTERALHMSTRTGETSRVVTGGDAI